MNYSSHWTCKDIKPAFLFTITTGHVSRLSGIVLETTNVYLVDQLFIYCALLCSLSRDLAMVRLRSLTLFQQVDAIKKPQWVYTNAIQNIESLLLSVV